MTIGWRTKNIRIMTADEIGGNLWPIVDAFRAGKAIYTPTGQPFRTVVLDSLTEESWRTQEEMTRRPNRPRGADENSLERGEWNAYNNALRNVLRGFRDSGVHLIVTALETESEGMTRPAIQGKQVRENLPMLFDTVARMVMRPIVGPDGNTVERRTLVLQAGVSVVAKDRSDPIGVLPRTMDDPTVTKMLDRIEEGRRRAAALER